MGITGLLWKVATPFLEIFLSLFPIKTGLHRDFPLGFRIMALLRVPLLMFIVVPLSFCVWLRRQYIFYFWTPAVEENFEAANRAHALGCQNIVSQVAAWKAGGGTQKLRTARPNWASMSTKLSSNKKNSYTVKLTTMDNILGVDFDKMIVTVEPGVNMGKLTQYLCPLGYALEVQVEMESITVAGLAMGFGIETNSHKSGFFQETVTRYEIVTGDAELINVTAESDPDLFYALPWSYGTLGFVCAMDIKICKVKPYVKVQYIPTFSVEELGAKMKALAESDNPPQFLEACAFSKDTAVIQVGSFSNTPGGKEGNKINSINYWFKPFYYRWVETFLEKGEDYEYIPLKHYYHRFTRSIFWELEDMIPFSNHPIYRTLWGWMGAPEVSLLKLFQGSAIRKASIYAHVVQESIMPIRFLAEGITKFDNWFGVYPLLVFPVRIYDRGEHSGMLTPKKSNLIPGKDYGIWIDVGAYGVPRAVKEGKMWDPTPNVRGMEHWTRSLGGFVATYTDMFCTRSEFRQMFNHTLLDSQRERFNCAHAFPEVYDKVKPEAGLVDLSAFATEADNERH